MKKENKKLAQQRKAQERRKQETKKKVNKVLVYWLPIIAVIIVIGVIIWAIASSGGPEANIPESTEDELIELDGDGSVDTSGEVAEYFEAEGTVCENGDTVVLDFSGSVDGVPFSGGTAFNQELTLGSGAFIPGFEEAIVGHKVGETFDIDVTFPEGYGNTVDSDGSIIESKLSGADAVFEITIHGVYK